jgi:hypothetical protein
MERERNASLEASSSCVKYDILIDHPWALITFGRILNYKHRHSEYPCLNNRRNYIPLEEEARMFYIE